MVDLDRYATQEWHTSVPSEQLAIEQAVQNPIALAARQLRGSFKSGELAVGRTWLSWQNRTKASPASGSALTSFETFVLQLEQLPLGAETWSTAADIVTSCTGGDAEACPSAVYQGMAKMAAQTFYQVASAVPILGYVASLIGLGVNVGRVIWAEARGAPEGSEQAPLELSAQADEERGRDVIGMTKGSDWTPLFLPEHDASQGGYFQHEKVRFPTTGEEGGRIWMGTQSGPVQPLGFGLLPGQAAVATQWQYRGKQASTGITALDRILNRLRIPIAEGVNPYRWTTYDIGYFRPSLPQLSSLLWAQVTSRLSAMFRVDASRLATEWDRYWALWTSLLYQLVEDGQDEAAQLAINVLMSRTGSNPFGWPHYGPGLVEEVDERYRDLLPISYQPTGNPIFLGGDVGWVEEVIPKFEGLGWWTTRRGWTLAYCDNLLELQRSTLRTISVAYLIGDEPALTGELRGEWEENRKLLLEHPALLAVDFDRVPPGEWREEALSRRLKYITGRPTSVPAAPGPAFVGGLTAKPAEALVGSFPWGQGALDLTTPRRMQFAAVDVATKRKRKKRTARLSPAEKAMIAGGVGTAAYLLYRKYGHHLELR